MSKDYGNFKQTKTNKDLSIEASSVYIGGAYLDNVINYSTEEKVVGTWIDGKPIYKKTFSLSGAEYEPASPSVNVSNLNISSINKIEATLGYTGGTNYYIRPIYYAGSNDFFLVFYRDNKLEIRKITTTDCKICITIEYTKTTD